LLLLSSSLFKYYVVYKNFVNSGLKFLLDIRKPIDILLKYIKIVTFTFECHKHVKAMFLNEKIPPRTIKQRYKNHYTQK